MAFLILLLGRYYWVVIVGSSLSMQRPCLWAWSLGAGFRGAGWAWLALLTAGLLSRLIESSGC